MSDNPKLEFGDAIDKGLKDYEDAYQDANLEESLRTLEQLFLARERIMILISNVKIDILESYVEKKGSE